MANQKRKQKTIKKEEKHEHSPSTKGTDTFTEMTTRLIKDNAKTGSVKQLFLLTNMLNL